jgi:hypothetical protein
LSSDEFLLTRLRALVEDVDPVPESVTAAARAVFRTTGSGSHSGAKGGAGNAPVRNEEDLVDDACPLGKQGAVGDPSILRDAKLVGDAGLLRLPELLGPPT